MNAYLSKKILFNLLMLFLLGYFIFHSVYGNRGFIAYFKLNQQLEKVQNDLNEAKAERVELEHKVQLLRSDSLDKDMLDEQARKTLGVGKQEEMIFVPEAKNLNELSRK
jgi:cell division protein FtsB